MKHFQMIQSVCHMWNSVGASNDWGMLAQVIVAKVGVMVTGQVAMPWIVTKIIDMQIYSLRSTSNLDRRFAHVAKSTGTM